MALYTLHRWQGLALIATSALFALGSLLLVLLPPENPLGAALQVLGFVIAGPAFAGLYAAQWQRVGRLGFVGFVLGAIGAVMYCVPVYLVLAGTLGVAGWHDSYAFASPLLILGAVTFLIGSILQGIATARAGVLPRWGGLLFAAGYALWFVAFWVSPLAFLLRVGSVVGGIGLAWLGWHLWSRRDATSPPIHARA